jgi:hypothetical protein
MAGPWLIGLLSDRLGIQMGFGVVVVYCMVVIISLLLIMTQPASMGRPQTSDEVYYA